MSSNWELIQIAGLPLLEADKQRGLIRIKTKRGNKVLWDAAEYFGLIRPNELDPASKPNERQRQPN